MEKIMKPVLAAFVAAFALLPLGLFAAEPGADEAKQTERRQVREAAKQLVSKWGGERWYTLHNKGARAPGWLRLSAKEKDGLIVLEDELFMTQGGSEARHLQTLQCQSDEYLTPVSIYVEAVRSQKPWVIEGEIKERRLIPRRISSVAREGDAVRLQPNFTTDFAVMHLVTLMPKTKGYELSVLQMFEKPGIEESILKFDGEEPVSLEGGTVNARRYTLSNTNTSDRVYWVDDSDRLVKIQVYSRVEFSLTDEKRAKNLPESHLSAKPQERPTPATVKKKPLNEAAIPVFPGAEGFGSRTPAGRGGKVIEVTSLADSGPGSLRAAVNHPEPRIIVFRVGGTIELKSQINVPHPFVTIAGQTAPGDGILLKNFGLVIQTHDVLVQHLRIRPGNEGKINPEDNDAIQVNGGSNVVVDHVSASWGEDEVVQTWDMAHDVTFSWCLISEALDKSRHPKGRHGGGVIFGEGSDRISLHHCVLAHLDFRNPLVINSGAVDVVENIIYNWGRTGGEVHDDAGFSAQINLIGNRYLQGPSSTAPEFVIHKGDKPASAYPKIFAQDNWGPRRSPNGTDEFALFSLGWGNTRLPSELRAAQPFASRAVTRLNGVNLLDAVVAGAGAIFPRRDPVDQRVVKSVRSQTGRMINAPSEAGGYPEMKGGEAPLDSDHDGMPDDWEKRMGLNPQDGTDAAADRDGNGYTNIEEYLHTLSKLR
jgi:pectate lyase